MDQTYQQDGCRDGLCSGDWVDEFAAHHLGGRENLERARRRGYYPRIQNSYDVATLRTLEQIGELLADRSTSIDFPDAFILRTARAASTAIPENESDFERLGINLKHVLKGIDATLTPSSHRSP